MRNEMYGLHLRRWDALEYLLQRTTLEHVQSKECVVMLEIFLAFKSSAICFVVKIMIIKSRQNDLDICWVIEGIHCATQNLYKVLNYR